MVHHVVDEREPERDRRGDRRGDPALVAGQGRQDRRVGRGQVRRRRRGPGPAGDGRERDRMAHLGHATDDVIRQRESPEKQRRGASRRARLAQVDVHRLRPRGPRRHRHRQRGGGRDRDGDFRLRQAGRRLAAQPVEERVGDIVAPGRDRAAAGRRAGQYRDHGLPERPADLCVVPPNAPVPLIVGEVPAEDVVDRVRWPAGGPGDRRPCRGERHGNGPVARHDQVGRDVDGVGSQSKPHAGRQFVRGYRGARILPVPPHHDPSVQWISDSDRPAAAHSALKRSTAWPAARG